MWHYSSKAEHMKENCKTCQQETQNWTVKAKKEAQRHWSICKWKPDKQKFWDWMRARTLKKEKWIQGKCTRNCKVVVKLNGTPEQAKILTTVYGKWKIWIDRNNGDCGEVMKIMSFFVIVVCLCDTHGKQYLSMTISEHTKLKSFDFLGHRLSSTMELIQTYISIRMLKWLVNIIKKKSQILTWSVFHWSTLIAGVFLVILLKRLS